MIGGRVLDASFLVAFASRTSVYAEAAVWAAVDRGVVLVVPSSAAAMAAAQLTVEDMPVLEVLLALPATVADDLTSVRARAVAEVVAELGGDLVTAHVVACARDRGWPIITDEPDRYRGGQSVEIEPLPWADMLRRRTDRAAVSPTSPAKSSAMSVSSDPSARSARPAGAAS